MRKAIIVIQQPLMIETSRSIDETKFDSEMIRMN